MSNEKRLVSNCKCISCGYDLSGTPRTESEIRCSECGTIQPPPITASEPRIPWFVWFFATLISTALTCLGDYLFRKDGGCFWGIVMGYLVAAVVCSALEGLASISHGKADLGETNAPRPGQSGRFRRDVLPWLIMGSISTLGGFLFFMIYALLHVRLL
ncbi:MAG: hypothetical protein ACREJO_13650 [Phycisphaerales bacterium]